MDRLNPLRIFTIVLTLTMSLLLVGCGGGRGPAGGAGGAMGEGMELADGDLLGDGGDLLGDGAGEDMLAGGTDVVNGTDWGANVRDNAPFTAEPVRGMGVSGGEDMVNFDNLGNQGGGTSFDTASAYRKALNSQDTLVAGPAMHTKDPKTAAMLDALNYAEGKPGPNQTFAYRNFNPGSDHPRKKICNGGYCSDAAGEYQIQSRTYDTYANRAGVKGFTKPDQEKLATYLMKDVRGANPQNIKDYPSFNREVGKLCKEWASVRCSNGKGAYGQPTKTNEQLWGEYQKSLKNRI